MGLLDDLLGNTSADASRKAAADTFAKQGVATAGLKDFGGQYAQQFGDLSKSFAPWQATGGAANDAVRNLISDPSSVRSLPGYQFDLNEGTKAIDHSALANGSLFSGKTGKALTAYGTNLADKTYGDQLARLLGVSQQGLGATGSEVATTGTGLTGDLSARTSAYGGDMTAAGTIGEGDVAAANAKTKGVQGLMNTAAMLGGMALTGGMGGGMGSLMSAGGNGIGSLLAPKGGYTGWTGR